jgi:DNA-binding transcriptional LysR family regulator
MIVNMNQLRSFYTAVKLNSISKAAQALMVTPSAITQHIKRFEEKIGVRALISDSHSLRLTSAGKGIMERAEKIFEEIHEMEGYLEDVFSGKTGELRVGCPEAPLKNVMSFIEEFKRTYPDVRVTVDQGSNTEMVKSIGDHRNDLAFVRYNPNNNKLKTKVLWREEIVLIASPQSTHWASSEISVMQLSQIPLVVRREGSAVRDIVFDYLRRSKVTPLIALESASTTLLKQLVQQDSGLGFIERDFIEQELKDGTLRLVRVAEGSPVFESGIAYADRRELSPAAWSFLRFVDKSWPAKTVSK